jgi:hypothetical protein
LAPFIVLLCFALIQFLWKNLVLQLFLQF